MVGAALPLFRLQVDPARAHLGKLSLGLNGQGAVARLA